MSLFGKHKHSSSQYPAGMKTLFRLTAFALAVCAVLSGCHTEVPAESADGSSTPTTAPSQTVPPVTTQPQPTETDPPETTAPKPTETEPPEPTVPEDFVIPDGIPDVVTYTTDLEDLPADYTPAQAAADGCVVLIEGDADRNENIWTSLTVAYSRGIAAKARFVDYFSTGQIKRIYEVVGCKYGFLYRRLENGEVTQTLYFHHGLKDDFIVKVDGDNYLRWEVFALTNEKSPAWPLTEGVPTDDSTWNNNMVLVFCEFTTVLPHPEIPQQLQKATLTYNGEDLGTLWNYDKLVALRELLAKAEGYVDIPKTVSWGPELTITGTDGKTITMRMMQNAPMVMIDEVFYLYDPGWKNTVHVEDIVELFGLTHPYPWEQ